MDAVNERFRRTFEQREYQASLAAETEKFIAEGQLSPAACKVLDEAVKGGRSVERSLAFSLYSVLAEIKREWKEEPTLRALRKISEQLCPY